MSEMILDGYPGYSVTIPADATAERTLWFAKHLAQIAEAKYQLAVMDEWSKKLSEKEGVGAAVTPPP